MCLIKRDTSGFPDSIKISLVGVNQATQTVHYCTTGTFSGQYRPFKPYISEHKSTFAQIAHLLLESSNESNYLFLDAKMAHFKAVYI